MKLEKLAPWNWFKKEEEHAGTALPVQRSSSAMLYPEPFRAMYDEIDRIFDSFTRGFGFPGLMRRRELGSGLALPWLKPSLDLSATDREYSVTVELPGVDPEDVERELDGDTLLIKGEKKHEKEESKKNLYHMERSYGAFQRMLSLPEDADAEAIDARFVKGVLRVTIPRRAAAARSGRSIQIKAA